MQANPITISMSQKYWKLIFVELPQYVCKSSCIFTTRILYFVRIHLVGENMEIHLVFTLQNNFKPLVSSKLAKVPYSKYLLGEDEKCVCNLQQPLKLTNQGLSRKNVHYQVGLVCHVVHYSHKRCNLGFKLISNTSLQPCEHCNSI